ncbi:MAG: hypothetical protein H7293_08935 [Candidatus Saccharibacteria bacterium]|nr:hypothetical protein [Rhodoferax sp.]
MTDDFSLSKLNALVGAALRGLIQSGADDQAIGAFAAEHRERVAQILGMPAASTEHPDLSAIVAAAVAEGIANGLLVAGKSKSRQRPAGTEFRRVFIVVAGVRTSVTVPNELLAKVATATGSTKAARRLVETYANQATDEQNRSGFTVNGLTQYLTLMQSTAGEGSATPRH